MAAFASRYARAFADVVIAQKLDPNRITAQMEELRATVAGSPDLMNVWTNPGVPLTEKIKLLDAIVARQKYERHVRNFIAVLIQHRRINGLTEVTHEFLREMDLRMGFAEAEIISARELNATEKRAMESQVGRLTGKRVRALYVRDESLIGGAVVKIGSTIYDGSVRGQLQRMKEEIAADH
jgi:F-type H+-transporting ATPase subunit delta